MAIAVRSEDAPEDVLLGIKGSGPALYSAPGRAATWLVASEGPATCSPRPSYRTRDPRQGQRGLQPGDPRGHERGGELGGAHVAPPPNLEEWRNFAHNLPATELYK